MKHDQDRCVTSSKAVQVERYVDSLIKQFGSSSADDYRWADHQLARRRAAGSLRHRVPVGSS